MGSLARAVLCAALTMFATNGAYAQVTDLERDLATVPKTARITLAIEIDPRLPFPQSYGDAVTRIVVQELAHKGISAHVVPGPAPVGLADHAGIAILTPTGFLERLSPDTRPDTSQPLLAQGYGQLPERTALIAITPEFIGAYELCPAASVLRIAAVALHEFGHVNGLIHPDIDVEGSDLPLQTVERKGNLMHYDLLDRVTFGIPPERCEMQYALTRADLAATFDSLQGRQLRSAITGGAVWRALQDTEFSYSQYVKRYRDGLQMRAEPENRLATNNVRSTP